MFCVESSSFLYLVILNSIGFQMQKIGLSILIVLCSMISNAQYLEKLASEYVNSKNIKDRTDIFRSIIDYNTKPYSIEKEEILQREINSLNKNHKFKEYVVLKTFYANLQGTKGLYDKSNQLCSELLNEDKTYIDDLLKVRIILTQGYNDSKKMNLAAANQKYVEAKEIAQQNNDIEGRINAELALMTGYLFVRQPDKALAEIDNIVSKIPLEDRKRFQSKEYRIKTACYILKSIKDGKDYTNEINQYSSKCVELANETNDQVSILGCYFALGLYYGNEKKELEKSNEYLLKAIEAGKKIGSFREVYLSYNYLIQNSIKSNDLEKAEAYAKESILATSDIDFEELKMEKYYSLAGIYLKKKQDKKVLEMIDSVRSSLIYAYNKRFDLKYAELQTKYETEKKEKQIALLDKDNQLKQLMIGQQANSLKQKDLEELNRRVQIQLLNKDKMLLSQNNELLNSENKLNEISLLKSDLEMKRQHDQQEKQRMQIEKLNATQEVQKLKSAFVYSSLAACLIGLSLFFLWTRNKQKQQNEIERQQYEVQILEGKLSTYAAQMNPHFMFNSINAVNNFILQKDSHEASRYLTKYSTLMREVLENSTHRLISLQDEVDTLKLYIEMEQLRFANKFTYTIEADDNFNFDDFSIPPLILQPYVENAICHGFLHKEGQGHLKIQFKDNQDSLLCIIDDDGVGRAYSTNLKSSRNTGHKSRGLEITASRLKIFNKSINENDVVKYIDKVDANGNSLGTRIEIIIPELIES